MKKSRKYLLTSISLGLLSISVVATATSCVPMGQPAKEVNNPDVIPSPESPKESQQNFSSVDPSNVNSILTKANEHLTKAQINFHTATAKIITSEFAKINQNNISAQEIIQNINWYKNKLKQHATLNEFFAKTDSENFNYQVLCFELRNLVTNFKQQNLLPIPVELVPYANQIKAIIVDHYATDSNIVSDAIGIFAAFYLDPVDVSMLAFYDALAKGNRITGIRIEDSYQALLEVFNLGTVLQNVSSANLSSAATAWNLYSDVSQAIKNINKSEVILPLVQNPVISPTKTKQVNLIPPDTPYETIHNLEFSFQFTNSGGFQEKIDKDGKFIERYVPNQNYYSVSGTGWLFDWKLNSDLPDNNGNINWTGYFATNLHVADALLNPHDTPSYRPSWFSSPTIFSNSLDKTLAFSLGKYDTSNGPLSSTNKKTNATYVKLSNLPTTQFASNDFVDPLLEMKGIADQETKKEALFKPFVDFAVLAITVKYAKDDFYRNQSYENKVWTSWIQPAMQTLKKLYPQNEAKPNLTYHEMFNLSSYVNQSQPNPGNLYIGGYPYSSAAKMPYYVNQRLQATGSPVWTINASKVETSYFGQTIDLNNTSGIRLPLVPNGIDIANPNPYSIIKYHGQEYKQYGVGYFVNNTSLGGGSSGSMALDSNNKIVGIYYGSINEQDDKLVSPGLVQSLIVEEIPEKISKRYTVFPYDLIGWSNNNSKLTNQTKSYFSSLTTPTYLFRFPT